MIGMSFDWIARTENMVINWDSHSLNSATKLIRKVTVEAHMLLCGEVIGFIFCVKFGSILEKSTWGLTVFYQMTTLKAIVCK